MKTEHETILLTTMGTTWQIVPELIGFTNPEDVDLYKHHPEQMEIKQLRNKFAICAVKAVWVVTTVAMTNAIKDLENWHQQVVPNLDLKIFPCVGVDDLSTADECERMADLIFRTVLHAAESSENLLISLAGGRKTMSADMQRAAFFFGCHALLHVIDRNNAYQKLKHCFFAEPLSRDEADCIMPLVLQQQIPGDRLTAIPHPLTPLQYPFKTNDKSLIKEIKHRQNSASDIFHNFATEILAGEQTNFRRLYTLSPEQVKRLKETRIGIFPEQGQLERSWLQTLPKAELHCHFGGILSTEEMVWVAQAETAMVTDLRHAHKEFDTWLKRVESAVFKQDKAFLIRQMQDAGKALRYRFSTIPEPFAVCGFLSAFAEAPDLLDELIFAELRYPEKFHAIGIERYEPLGDLQGSGLLQTEGVIRRACAVLKAQTQRENITYLELRCSPNNYTRGGLTGEQVVSIMLDTLNDDGIDRVPGMKTNDDKMHSCRFQLIFIASRHGSMEKIYKHIDLAKDLLDKNEHFRAHFSGFDLAGAESAKKPSELRTAFLPLMERCLQLTIHAGEDEAVENIWQAVYHLNADRIGHGLTLGDNPELMQRFIDRKIAVELCPSSNFQIVGFKDADFPEKNTGQYPLKNYLSEGVKVTLNTDDPGISRTTISNEYLKAARMTQGGLTSWEILQLIRNGYRAAFAHHKIKGKCLVDAETQIMKLIEERSGIWQKK